jgi:hypothetical protein
MIELKQIFLMISVLTTLSCATIGFAQVPGPDDFNVRIDSLSSKNDTVKTSAKSPTGAMIRAIIFPGWGQLYNKKYFKAVLVFGAEVGLIANSIYLNQKLVASHTDVEREFYINNRNLSNWWLIGVILYSVVDAFVDAQLSNFDDSPNLSSLIVAPKVNSGDFGVKLSLLINF